MQYFEATVFALGLLLALGAWGAIAMTVRGNRAKKRAARIAAKKRAAVARVG